LIFLGFLSLTVPLLTLLEHFAEQAHTSLLFGSFGIFEPHLQARYLTGDHVENSVLHRQAQTTGSKVEDEGWETALLVAIGKRTATVPTPDASIAF
jgi:hypothetical protein